MSTPMTEETGQLILRELRILNTGSIGRQKANWKTAHQITQLTVWKNKRNLEQARKHELVRYKIESQSIGSGTKQKASYRYDYNSIAPEYLTTYQIKVKINDFAKGGS